MPIIPNGDSRFRVMLASDLPDEWQRPLTVAQLQQGADLLGIPAQFVRSVVMFSGPECRASMDYQRFQIGAGSGRGLEATVSICVQHPGNFTEGRAPGVISSWIAHLEGNGHPPMWSLVRIFYDQRQNPQR